MDSIIENFPTSNVLGLNENQKAYNPNNIFINGEPQSSMHNDWEMIQENHIFNEDQSSMALQKHVVEDSKTHHKEK